MAAGRGKVGTECSLEKNVFTNLDKELVVCYSNVDVFINKKNEILAMINRLNPDVIALTEIKPKNASYELQPTDLQLQGYDCWPKITGDGRGVAVFTHARLKANNVPVTPGNFKDAVFCSIRLRNNDHLLLGCIYRSPNSSRENNDNLEKVMAWAMSLNYSHVCITGDFNYKEIDWESNSANASNNHQSTKFLIKVNDLFLYQHVEEPTHYRAEQTPSRLDLVFTNEPNLVSDLKYETPLGASHHLVLPFKLRCYTEDRSSARKIIHKFAEGDYEGLRRFIGEHKWQECEDSAQVGDLWREMTEVVQEGINKFIPKKIIDTGTTQKTKPPWMNTKALEKIKSKHKAFNRYRKTKEGKDYEIYRKERNKARKATRKAAMEHEKKITESSKSNNKAFYKHVNSKLKVRTTIAELKKDGKIAVNDAEKVEMLNRYFASVFTEERNDIPNTNDDENRLTNRKLETIKIREEDVVKKLKDLNANKSPGPDLFHPRVLKEVAEELGPTITILFQKSIDSGKVPEDWKVANVTPIFKKGCRNDPGNYRPVSLTSTLCKVLERFITESITTHMDENQLFSEDQYGFRQRRSCTSQLLSVVEAWTDSLEEECPVDCVFFDFRKAFDSVPHRRLLSKLEKYGLSGNVVRWIGDYLRDRRQRVVINGMTSQEVPVTSGVPQGSVLGPTLFILYINDLPDTVSANVRLFADDTKLFGPAQSLAECSSLQSDIDKLDSWAARWQMTFHPSKCKVLRIGSNHTHYEYKMLEGNTPVTLEIVDSEKDLGILTDRKLSFEEHINATAKKGNQLVGMIKRSFNYLNRDMLSTLIKSIIRPVMEYGHAIWNPHLKKHKIALERIQRRATKLIPPLRDLPYSLRLQLLKLPSLEYRRRRGDIIETWKLLHGKYDQQFPWLVLDTGSALRGHGWKLKKVRRNNSRKMRAFSFRVVNDWNSLPERVVNCENINAFKNALDEHWRNRMYRYTEYGVQVED